MTDIEHLMKLALDNQAKFCADNNIEPYHNFDKHYAFYRRLGFSDPQSANFAYEKCEKEQ